MEMNFGSSISSWNWMLFKVVREIGKGFFFIKIQVHRYVEYAKQKSNEANFVRKLHWTNQGKRL